MTLRYRLPCPNCNGHLDVAPPQAGENLRCHCGASVVVPTLRELRRLPPVEPPVADQRNRPGWDLLRGTLFVVGMLLLASGLLAHLKISPQRQRLDLARPAFRELNFDIQVLTPVQAWEAWDYFRQQDLETRLTPRYLENRAKHRTLTYYLLSAWTFVGAGAALAIAAVAWPHRP